MKTKEEWLSLYLSIPLELRKEFADMLNTPPVFELFEPKANGVAKKVKRRRNTRGNVPWSDEDRLWLFEQFEKYGRDRHMAKSWARTLGRSVSAVLSQFDKSYQDSKEKMNRQ